MIQNGKTVKIHYKLSIDGHVIDSSDTRGPFEYQHGHGQIIPGLERALEGLQAGDVRQISIGPDDAYGPVNPKAIVDIPRNNLQDEEIQIGMVLSATDPNGNVVRGSVIDVHPDKVTADFNHPLAGKELLFEVTVIEIL